MTELNLNPFYAENDGEKVEISNPGCKDFRNMEHLFD
jgi:hypothetical protein